MQSHCLYQKQIIFIDLRARGRTLHRIGEILGISPSTLARWERRCLHAIADSRACLSPPEPNTYEQADAAAATPRSRLKHECKMLRAHLELEYRQRMLEIIAICFVRSKVAPTPDHSEVLSLLDPRNCRCIREMSAADFAKRLASLSRAAFQMPGQAPSLSRATSNQRAPSVANN